MKYQVIDLFDSKGNETPYADINGYTFKSNDYEEMYNRFYYGQLYKALFGGERYARSIATAEYLYSIFKSGCNLDYTSVVSGYIKAVEQLLHRIIQIIMVGRPDNGLYIDITRYDDEDKEYVEAHQVRIKNRYKIPLKPENEKFFDITMGSMLYCLNATKGNWLINVSIKDIRTILNCYRDECRNEHFHKDNISEYEIVEKIRSNTLFVIFMLLGGCNLSGSLEKDLLLLGVKDDSFTRLFKAIRKQPSSIKYVLYWGDGRKETCFRWVDVEDLKYDANGMLEESKITFVLEDNTFVEITRDNIPKQISFITFSGEEREIIW